MYSTKMMYFAFFCVAMASFAHAGLNATECSADGDEDDMYNAVDCTMDACRDEISNSGGNALLISVTLLLIDSIQLGLYLIIQQLLKVVVKISLLGIITISIKIKVAISFLNFALNALVGLVLSVLDLLTGQIIVSVFIGDVQDWCDTYSTSVQNQCNGDSDFTVVIQLFITIIVQLANCCKECLSNVCTD